AAVTFLFFPLRVVLLGLLLLFGHYMLLRQLTVTGLQMPCLSRLRNEYARQQRVISPVKDDMTLPATWGADSDQTRRMRGEAVHPSATTQLTAASHLSSRIAA